MWDSIARQRLKGSEKFDRQRKRSRLGLPFPRSQQNGRDLGPSRLTCFPSSVPIQSAPTSSTQRDTPGTEFFSPRSRLKPLPRLRLDSLPDTTCRNSDQGGSKLDSHEHMSEVLYQIMGRHRSEPLPERKPSWLKV